MFRTERYSSSVARPRTFDRETALDSAVDVFWEHGYEGASLTQLCAAMGINKPSLYAAFGDKRRLFEEVVERYVEEGPAWGQAALDLPSVADAVSTYLHRTVDAITRAGRPHGCLVVQSAGKCSPASSPVREHVAAARAAGLSRIRDRLDRARAENDPALTGNPATLTVLVASIAEGMAVRADDGTPADELHAAVELGVTALFGGAPSAETGD